MEQNKHFSPKANRILYAVVVGALCIAALIIGIVSIANRPQATRPPSGGTVTLPPSPATKPNGQEPSAPTGGEDGETVYLCPLSGSVSRAHDLENLYYSDSMGDWRTHAGIDITAKLGEAVKVVADGVVKEIWEDTSMGTCVAVEHADKLVSVYKNLAPTLGEGVTVGARLSVGDTVGAVGETAGCELSEEAHLHLEFLRDEVAVDPLSVLSKESCKASLTFRDEAYED